MQLLLCEAIRKLLAHSVALVTRRGTIVCASMIFGIAQNVLLGTNGHRHLALALKAGIILELPRKGNDGYAAAARKTTGLASWS